MLERNTRARTPLLSVREVEKMAGLSPGQLYRARVTGIFPSPTHAVSGRPWWDENDVVAWLDSDQNPWRAPQPPPAYPGPRPWEDGRERAEIVTFTPEMCEYILAHCHKGNRPLGSQQVAYLASEITEGYWARNGETIIFSKDGELRNGQHRLRACVLSGKPIESWVVFGIDPAAFDTMDRTKRRSSADDLAIEGEQNCTTLASMLGMVWLDEQDKLEDFETGDARRSINQHIVRQMLQRRPEARSAVDWAKSQRSLCRLLSPRLAAFLSYRLPRSDEDKARQFLMLLADGEGLRKEDVVWILRERLTDNLAAKAKLPTTYCLALAIKAWNLFKEGKTTGSLRWRSSGESAEKFPKIS